VHITYHGAKPYGTVWLPSIRYRMVMIVTRLTKDDWAEAALAAIAEGGLAAVKLESLAESLGATKGSVYWHFGNRQALLRHTLLRWEHDYTDTVINRIEGASSAPLERLRHLFASVLDTERGARIELALQASINDPMVRNAVLSVAGRRTAYLASLFRELGFGPKEAAHRARLAHAVYLGHVHYEHMAPPLYPDPHGRRRAYLDHILDTLTQSPTMSFRISIRVHSNASRTRVGGHRRGSLLVSVTAPAEKSKANEATRRALADAFDLRLNQVAIIRGHTAPDKVVELDLDPAEAQPILTALLGV
jgi:AcrR family transcriptional regulator